MGTFGGAEEIKAHPWFKSVDWDEVMKKNVEPPIPYLKRKVKKGDGQVIIEVPENIVEERRQLVADENFITGWSFVKS